MKSLVCLLLSAICVVTVINSLKAADFKADNSVTVSQPVNEDMYAAGGTLNFNAVINGDLLTAGGNIYVTDSITGDFMAAGGTIYLDGPVSDDVRLAGGTVKITRNVNDDVLVFGGEITIGKEASIAGDLIIFGGEVFVDGVIEGNLIIKGGECSINGTVNGETDIKGGELNLNGNFKGTTLLAAEKINVMENGLFNGEVRYWQRDGALSQTPATGNWVFDSSLKMEEYRGEKDYGMWWGFGITTAIIVTLLSTLLIIFLYWLLFQKAFRFAGDQVYKKFLNSFGVGILYFIAFPPLAILLMILIIGLPVGMFMLGLYGFTIITGHAIAALAGAYAINNYYNKNWKSWQVILVALGIDILLKIMLLIPVLGFLISLIAVSLAVGALILYIWESFQKPAVA